MSTRCTVRWLTTTKQSTGRTSAPFESQWTSAAQRHREARKKRQEQQHLHAPTENHSGMTSFMRVHLTYSTGSLPCDNEKVLLASTPHKLTLLFLFPSSDARSIDINVGGRPRLVDGDVSISHAHSESATVQHRRNRRAEHVDSQRVSAAVSCHFA